MPAPRWMSQAACEEFSWSQTLGGTRGVIETSAPGLIFVIVYVATHALVPTLVAASAVAVIACIIRLIQRQSIQQAVSGFFRRRGWRYSGRRDRAWRELFCVGYRRRSRHGRGLRPVSPRAAFPWSASSTRCLPASPRGLAA